MNASPATTSDRRAALSLPWSREEDVFVDGAWRISTAQRRLPVVDPATGQEWGSVPDASPADVEAAVGAAVRAFRAPEWRTTTAHERAAMLVAMAEALEERAEELALTVTRENGSPLAETRGAAANAAGILRHIASFAGWLEEQDVRPFPGAVEMETVVRKEPVGPCVLIAPWNFPINLMVIKLAPALLAGCTVVMKPAETTPLSTRFLVEAAQAAGFPPGVVNLVTGSGAVGDALVRHPDVAKVAFTGSTPVGRIIGRTCGELLKPVTLELGGKSAAIVLPDVDLDQLAAGLVRTSMRNTGQTCYIATRLLVPAERYDEVLERVATTIAAQPQGDPLDAETVFGPVANVAQFVAVQEHVAKAVEQGARVVVGGDVQQRPGYFISPTVLADVTPDMDVARQEVFGPVLSVLSYRSLDEAVEVANDSDFGLGGLVWSSDPEAALAVAELMDTGSVGINGFASNHDAPFGGRRDSGLGVEYGLEGLSAYVAHKSIHRKTPVAR